MLNVLIFAPFALENGRGGEISVIELAAGLQNYYKVSLIDTNRLMGKNLLSEDIIKKKLKGVNKNGQIKYSTLKIFNKIFDFPYPWDVIKLYKKIRKNNIIYFSVSNFKTDFIFMMFILLLRRVNFIAGYRKPLYSKKLISLYNIKIRLTILFFSLFKKRLYHHTISHNAKKFLENFYNPSKVFHIIHGIELENYSHKDIIKKEEAILNFIYVGHLDDVHKGLGLLLKAIENLLKENKKLNIFFEFCGEGPLQSKLKALEKRFPEFIRYHGYVNNEKISEYYKKNDIFLFTSRREPFGRVLIEALAAGLLILCSKTYGSIEILKNKEFAFFFQELSSECIKLKILEIYDLWTNNPLKLKKLIKSTKIHAFQNFSFSKELEMFKDLIDKIYKTII